MNYSIDEAMVRVDFFRPSGKWYATEAVRFVSYEGGIHEAFAESLREHLGARLSDMDAVCLHPYHEHAHPLQIKNGGWLRQSTGGDE